MESLASIVSAVSLIAAADGGNQWLIPVIILAVVVLIGIGIKVFGGGKPAPDREEIPKAKPVDEHRPTASILDEREEVDGPVVIHEGMSLAEVKRAKSARIKRKDKRETATEATAQSKKEHESLDDPEVSEDAPDEKAPEPIEADLDEISGGWDDMLAGFDGEDEGAEDPAPAAEPEEAITETPAEPEVEEAAAPVVDEQGATLAAGLAKTRNGGFISRLGTLFQKEQLDDDLVDEVEEILFTADIGTKAAQDILRAIEDRLDGDEKRDPAAVWAFVRTYVESILDARESHLDVDQESPFVIMVVGVNGVGKTTTIGKLASRYKRQGKSVLLVAGDTFRAAAVEQLGVWGERTGIEVHQGEPESDPASVVFSGVEKGVAQGVDVIICDTAGRLHTKSNLLDELKKIVRVAGKVVDGSPHETILVLDANTWQNAIQQAKQFSEVVEITGIVLTKLDGTAKGGVILGICEELNAPIRFIGIGEGVADLREFDASEFVEALFM